MADDKAKRDFRDRDRVSADEGYEVRYFAKQHRITPEQVRALIGEHGNDRKTLEREARKVARLTKLSDLGPPIIGQLQVRAAVSEEEHFMICPACGQAVDKRDLRQVIWHEPPCHKPLEMDS